MYSGVDLDAFTTALKGGNKSVSQPFDSAQLSQASNYSFNHSVSHWNDSAQNEFTNRQLQQDMNQREELHGSAMVGRRRQNPPIHSQRVQNEVTKSQYPMPTHNLTNVSRNSQAGSGRPPQSSSQIYRKSIISHADASHLNPSTASQVKVNSSNAMDESNLHGFQGMETETDLYGKRSTQINMKQERQYVYISPREISIYGTPGGINHHSLSGSNTNSLVATSSLKQQGLDTHMRHGLGLQSVGGAQLGTSTQCMDSFMQVKRNNINSSSGSTIFPSPVPRSITAQEETMYSDVDLDAFVDGNKSVSQPFDSAHLSQANNYISNHSVSHWNDSAQNEFTNQQLQQDMNRYQREEPHGSAMVGCRLQNPPILTQRVQNEVTKSQYPMPTHNLPNVAQNSQAGSGRPPQFSSQIYQKSTMFHADMSHLNPSPASQVKANSSNAMDESNLYGFQGMETETDLYRKRSTQINMKQERQYVYISPREISIYGTPGGINHRSLSGSNTNSLVATSSLKQQGLDTHMMQGIGHQSVGGAQLGTSTRCMNSFMEVKRNSLNSSSGSTTIPRPLPHSITAQLNTQIMHEISSEGSGNYAKIPPKKPSIRQKKPHNSLVSTAPQPSKKQKVSGSLADESIEQLNDVTAVSGVNLSEEEEQLFSGFMEDSRVSEESLRVVKEEEERLILQKTPLRNKLAEIMSKYGVKNMNGDVERCLSLGVEERMRVFLSSLIRVSKQRVDVEKSMHHTLVTSDIRKQIMEINQKAREEWDTKEFKAEKLQNSNEPEGGDGVDCDKEKENCRAKSLKQKKVNKEEDDKMRATAANDAARAAIGGGDMFSKWKLMAEQARRQKPKDISLNTSPSIVKASTENQDLGESGQQNAALVFGSSRKSVNSQMRPQTEVARSISVEDVISVLEREPQMSKSEVLYRLYEKSDADIDA